MEFKKIQIISNWGIQIKQFFEPQANDQFYMCCGRGDRFGQTIWTKDT